MKANSTRFIDYSCWIIGLIIVLSAITRIQLLFDLFNFDYFLEKAIAIIYFSSAIIAAFGLYRLNTTGFIFAYVHIIVATVFLSISMVPFLFNFLMLDHQQATTLLLIINISILFATACLHGLKRWSLKQATLGG